MGKSTDIDPPKCIFADYALPVLSSDISPKEGFCDTDLAVRFWAFYIFTRITETPVPIIVMSWCKEPEKYQTSWNPKHAERIVIDNSMWFQDYSPIQ
jgi:hypothetical protein